jgi:hypothetical protein
MDQSTLFMGLFEDVDELLEVVQSSKGALLIVKIVEV